ncbi:MAG TPA: hypothetical protein VMJ66_13280 [Geobacteraceae bacterium]|nr:hypothetical protein [Geobacteraceae bacterium]
MTRLERNAADGLFAKPSKMIHFVKRISLNNIFSRRCNKKIPLPHIKQLIISRLYGSVQKSGKHPPPVCSQSLMQPQILSAAMAKQKAPDASLALHISTPQ